VTYSPASSRHAPWPHPIAAIAFFAGSALADCFLTSTFDWATVFWVAAACTATWAATGLVGSPRRAWRGLGWAAWLGLLACYTFWVYLVIAFGVLLGWTVSMRLWALIAAVGFIAVATLRRPRKAFHIPLVLPLGMLIATLLSGWLREEKLTRCDDFLALRAPVELVFDSRSDFDACRKGEVLPAGRFPRTIWQAPDGERVIFTTQGDAVAGGIDGSFCEAHLGTGAPAHCVGPPFNKSQGLIDLPERNRLLGMQWGIQTPSGKRGSVVFELSRQEPLAILAEHWFDQPLGDGFYEPRNATLYMFSDEMDGIYRATLPSFGLLPVLPYHFAPGELHYDRGRGEGVACGNATGAAIRGAPFTLRYLAAGSSSPLERVSLTWGCDWDESSRKVYSTIPNLGLLDRIDYDTGRVEKRWFVGLGMRSVAYDRARRRVYFNNFLRGEVLAFDERSERITDRWFVGRFSRWVRLTRDGRALLATSNLGIVRIPLTG
jgi:hypothetical protein